MPNPYPLRQAIPEGDRGGSSDKVTEAGPIQSKIPLVARCVGRVEWVPRGEMWRAKP